MGQSLSEERSEAVRRAIADVMAKYAAEHRTEVNKKRRVAGTPLLGEWFGVSQQAMSHHLKTGNVGLKLAEGVAKHLGTTVDGLVWRYVAGGKGAVRAGDIPNWQRAVEEARRKRPEFADHPGWALAAEVFLPVAPAFAEWDFAYDLMMIFCEHIQASGTIRKVVLQGRE